MGKLLLILLLCASTAAAERLVEPKLVARGEYLAPRWSPDGRELLVTGPQLRGLVLVPLAGSPRALTSDAEAGVHARWLADGTIAYRTPRAGTRIDVAVDRAGQVRPVAAPAAIAFARDDRMYVQRGQRVVEVGTGDRFFGAVVSPDGERVAFQGLVTGIYVYTRATGALVHVGPGTAPAWSADGKRLAFELTEDDGHVVLASDLYLYDVAGDRVSRLTATPDVIERRPSFSPTGGQLAFDDNVGGIFVARLAVQP